MHPPPRDRPLLVALCLVAGALAGCVDAATPADASTDAPALVDRAAADLGPVDAPDGGAAACEGAVVSRAGSTSELVDGADRATVTMDDPAACARSYQLRTTAPLRDGQPGNPRTVRERDGWPTLRSGHDLFDALYALAVDELRENSVAAIRDGSFNNGGAIDCPAGGCFETGRLWNYVWTRDTAYAADLALAAMDPLRTRNSLLFKLSPRRTGADPQIVQDTGTGGSYPVSTDRVVWALGATELLKHLTGDDRAAFLDRAYPAMRNTAEHDRRVIFDARDGLYRGEHSFLDWREQSYAAYTATDPVHIAMSRSLSTNVLHFNLLDALATLAVERGDAEAAARYRPWADALKQSIQRRFWLAADGQFSAFTSTELDPSPVRRWDALGTALAVLTGVATEAQAREAVGRYPHAGRGLPVIWPQQQFTAIYHNRASWPFVTAYWLRAARQVRNDASVDWNVDAMVRAAALNLSNMENFEFSSGRPRVEDGAYSGPVVNSQRQLWSVAGYLSMVHDVVFGLETSAAGFRLRPYITRAMRHAWFARADRIVLRGFLFRGRRLDLRVALPPPGADRAGAYAVGAVRVNGVDVGEAFTDPATLPDRSTVEVTLVDTPEARAPFRDVADLSDWHQVYGPRTPTIAALAPAATGRVQLRVDVAGEERGALDVVILRDGQRVATLGPTDGETWTETLTDEQTVTHCYSVETVFRASGNASQHAAPQCWWGAGAARVQALDASRFVATGGQLATDHGRPHYENWGDPGHRLEVPALRVAQSGAYLLQVTAGNGAGGTTTGVTCGVKRLQVIEAAGGRAVAEGYVVMPQLGSWDEWRDSSFVRATLEAGRDYRVVLGDDEVAVNMSAFEHFARYTGGTGGAGGAFFRVNVAGLKVLYLGPAAP
ncbi:MAG: Six-hairpin glycosidase-like protein [Myxococcaceae bacterium]|nr:Six-hairpin glycosidase-like protein [Myxococcaceae bacterium]